MALLTFTRTKKEIERDRERETERMQRWLDPLKVRNFRPDIGTGANPESGFVSVTLSRKPKTTEMFDIL